MTSSLAIRRPTEVNVEPTSYGPEVIFSIDFSPKLSSPDHLIWLSTSERYPNTISGGYLINIFLFIRATVISLFYTTNGPNTFARMMTKPTLYYEDNLEK